MELYSYEIDLLHDLNDWLTEAEDNGELSIDTETTSLDPHQAKLVH